MNLIELPDDATEVPVYEDTVYRPRLSLTSDVLDFRKCNRKYGLYKIRGFSGSSPTAEFVGTFAHRAMEEAWQHYRNEANAPTKVEVIEILDQVRQDLLEEGRSPHSWPAVLHAGYQILRMTATMSELDLFEDIVDSERTLRSGEEDYVLEGVVDMILHGSSGHVLWDFKSARDPRRSINNPDATVRSKRASEQMLNDYSLQLRLYHFLCEEVLEHSPEHCEVIFLGELGKADIDFSRYENLKDAWMATEPEPLDQQEWDSQRQRAKSSSKHGLFYSVANHPDDVAAALEEFEDTAKEILQCRESDEWSPPSESKLPTKQTCEDCDFLESCRPAMNARSNE